MLSRSLLVHFHACRIGKKRKKDLNDDLREGFFAYDLCLGEPLSLDLFPIW